MLTTRVTAGDALQATLDALQGAAPLETVLDTLLQQVRSFLAADEAYLMQLYVPLREGERLVVRAALGMPAGALGRSIGAATGLEGVAVTTRATVAMAEAGAEPRFVDPFGRVAPPGALLAVPMLVRGQATGVVVAARRAPGRFDAPSVWWLERLAGLAAVAVAQDEAARFQERRAHQAEVLLGLADTPGDDPDQLLPRLADAISRGLGVDHADLLLHDPDGRDLTPLGSGANRLDTPGGDGLGRIALASEHPAARVFRTGEPLLAADTALEPAAEAAYGAFGVRSVAVVPLRVGAEVRGVLHVAAHTPGALGPDDLGFLYLLAARVGLMLERQEVQSRRADARAREEFLGIVSHELKTPVAVMQAYVELLQRRAEREQRTAELEVLGEIAGESQRMLAMVEELLDVQRLEVGVLHLEVSRFDLAALARRLTEALQLTAPAHRIAVDAPAPVVVVADRRRVEEVVSNLVENAVKYSPDGGEVRVSVALDEHVGQPVARVTVTDQGVGIAPEERARVFDRFYRVRADRGQLHRGHHGLGLGLYIAREIVRRHGGEIGVEAAPDRGSTFWFHLPVAGPEEEP
jgi:signal transduction histidine kinase